MKKHKEMKIKGKATIREVNPNGEIISEQTAENIIVDVGAEVIRSLLDPSTSTTSNFNWMLIGQTAQTAGQESATDTELTNQLDAEERGSPNGHIVADGKKLTWKDWIFHQGVGKGTINEMAISTGDNPPTDTILNRVIFTAVDNEANDLLVDYELEVLSG